MKKRNLKTSQRQPKPLCIAYIASSIDGKISKHKKTMPDWTSVEDWKFFQKELAKCDAVVVGRNTYLAAADRLRKRNTFVLTQRIKTSRRLGRVLFINPLNVNLSEVLRKYRQVAIVGGSQVFSYMLNIGLMDELYITLEPIVLGDGKEMFERLIAKKRFKLLSVRKINLIGSILLHYRIM